MEDKRQFSSITLCLIIASESKGGNVVVNFHPIYNVLGLTDREGCTMGLWYMFILKKMKLWME